MLIQLLFLLFLLVFLFFLSRKVSRSLFTVAYFLTSSRGAGIWTLAVLFLPGTIVHELSHFIVATLLRVRTGKLTILPTVESTGEIRAGALYIEKPDPFRHIIIGIAPMIIGLIFIYIIGTLLPKDLFTLSPLYAFLFGYVLFVVSNTMFSSKKDLESLIIVGPIVILVITLLYTLGVRVGFNRELTQSSETVLTAINRILFIAAIVDFAVWIVLVVLVKIQKTLFKIELH